MSKTICLLICGMCVLTNLVATRGQTGRNWSGSTDSNTLEDSRAVDMAVKSLEGPPRGHGDETLATAPNIAVVGDFFDKQPKGLATTRPADKPNLKPMTAPTTKEAPIDFDRARSLRQKKMRGETLTAEEEKYLLRARQEFEQGRGPRQQTGGKPSDQQPNAQGARMQSKESMGYKPLCDMTAEDRYKGEDGGLYGGGKNQPPEALQAAINKELAAIQPLDAEGKPAAQGRIVMISLGMSNTTAEFSRFKQIADADADKSPLLTIVDCAQGGKTALDWAGGPPPAWIKDAPSPWREAEKRLQNAHVSPLQVQVAWVKMANRLPKGELAEHARQLEADIGKTMQLAREHFPNLRIAYLSSRIYGGYATIQLNPEPYAYEGAFAVRWLILEQLAGKADWNYNPERGAVKAPLLVWGPYLWADGIVPRQSDGLSWLRTDLAEGDGTHPSATTGCRKVAEMLLHFCKTDPNAKSWFVRGGK